MKNSEYILEMNGITKEFPGVRALDNVSLKVKEGEVHALLGENGAGKSTLMKVLMSIYPPDSGEVYFMNQKRSGHLSVRKVLEDGISMIHQELAAVPDMTIADNVHMNRMPNKGIFVDEKKMNRDTLELFLSIGLEINPEWKIKELTTSYVQMVEIARAVSAGAKLIIMDEPTSAITEQEVEMLFRVIRKLRNEKKSIIYITHKMDEIFQIADTVTVLRDGQSVASNIPISGLDYQSLINMMVGREITQMFPENLAVPGEIAMKVEHLSKAGEFHDISFEVHKGEILGIAGMMGAGRSELMSAVFGITRPDSGEVFVHGEKMRQGDPRESISRGMAMLTEDRKGTGLFLGMSITDNIVMPSLKQVKKALFLSRKKMEKIADKQVKDLLIKTAGLGVQSKNLSGGNQQKVLLGRWLCRQPEILIVDEPTRGIDVGAKYEIHKILCDLAKSGKAVIMISSEMPEVVGISSRVLVIADGRITGELCGEEIRQENIMKYAAKLEKEPKGMVEDEEII